MQYAKICWHDDQPHNEDFNDIYFAREGGRAESEYVFLQKNDLPRRWLQQDRFVIGETGFGTGLNFLVTVDAWLKTARPDATLYYFSAEKFPLQQSDLQTTMSAWPELSSLASEVLLNWPAAVAGYHYIELFQRRVLLILMLGDAKQMLQQMTSKVDAWYLDGFAPARNPEMWSLELLSEIARNSHAHGTFSTYTAAGEVRRRLQASGFAVNKVRGFAAKRDMLCGYMQEPGVDTQQTPWFSLPRPASQAKKIAVIGAGIAGITSAWSLARRGFQVDLFDRHAHVAMGGSGNPAGVLLPRIAAADSIESEFYASAFFTTLRRLSMLRSVYPELSWQQTGVVQLLSSARLHQQYNSQEYPPEYVRAISATETNQLCGLNVDAAAMSYPLAGWLEPRNLCEILLADADKSIDANFDQEVGSLRRHNDAWLLLDPQQRELGCYQQVILANAHQVLQYEQTAWMNVLPARGQISYLPATQNSRNLLCPICYDGYVLPATAGNHVIGASFATGIADIDLSPAEHEQNMLRLQQYVPALTHNVAASAVNNLTGRAALRAVTPDRLPIAGAVPDMDYYRQYYCDLHRGKQPGSYPNAGYLSGLYVNTGHGARGLTSAFLTAEMVSAMMAGDVLPVSKRIMHALHPARFFIRQARRGKLPES